MPTCAGVVDGIPKDLEGFHLPQQKHEIADEKEEEDPEDRPAQVFKDLGVLDLARRFRISVGHLGRQEGVRVWNGREVVE